MDRIRPLLALIPNSVGWTVKVKVTRKGSLRSFSNAKGRGHIFNVELSDENGTRMEATMFDGAAEKFHLTFELGKMYYVSKGKIRPAKQKFATVNVYEMILSSASVVEEILDEPMFMPQQFYKFVKIEDLTAYVNKRTTFDVIGILHNVSSTTSVKRKADNNKFPKREITLIDESGKTVMVSIWNNLAVEDGAKLERMRNEAPVVIIQDVQTHNYQGVSLMTTPKSAITINPINVPESEELKSWYSNRHMFVATNIDREQATISEIRSPAVGKDKIEYFYVRACVSYILPEQKLSYFACSVCQRKVLEQSKNWCESCQCQADEVVRKYILVAKLADHTGETWVSFFGDEAQQILGVSVEQLEAMKNNVSLHMGVFPKIDFSMPCQRDGKYALHLKHRSWSQKTFRVSVRQREHKLEMKHNITVRSISNVNWAAEAKLLLYKLERLRTD